MIQLVEPDLTVKDEAGACLRFTDNVFKTAHGIPTASEAWKRTKFKHFDALPNNSVPVWFSWRTDGHVATYVPGKGVFSSPLSGFGNVWFSSVQDCANKITQSTKLKSPCVYLGWTEDLTNVRIVKGDNMPSTVNIERVNELFVAFWTRPQIEAEAKLAGKTASEWLNGWVGTESNTLIQTLAESPQYRNKRLDAENELAVLKQDLKTCQAGGTTLAPGKYLVK